jgi:hydrogenase maturation protease
MTECRSQNILIVCIGNDLAGDDGAGKAVFDRLRAGKLPESVELIHLGLGGMALYEYFHGQRLLIVVDAVQLNATPGFVHVMNWNCLPAIGGQAVSLHGVGLAETLSVARLLYPELTPERTVLIGIEGRRFSELGVPMSTEVEEAIGFAVEEVKQQIICTREGSYYDEQKHAAG